MKKILAAAAALAFAPAIASAADLPARTAAVAPAPVYAAMTWTGFYLGGNVGYAWSRSAWTHIENGALGAPAITSERFSVSPDGFAGGLQAGGRYQFANNVVVGLEAGYTWRNADDQQSTNLGGVPRYRRAELGNIWAVTGQVGYAFGNVLGYVKGGYASTKLSYSNILIASGAVLGSSKSDVHGYTLGAGVEYAFTRNISAGLEYDYYKFNVGDQNQLNSVGAYAGAYNASNKLDNHIVSLRLNYRFGL